MRFNFQVIFAILIFKQCEALSTNMTSSYNIEVVPSPLSVLGEGPHWDIQTQSLYYIDIYGTQSTILRYDYAENKTYEATIDGEPVISFIIPVDGTTNEFVIGIGRRVGVIEWNGKSPKAKLLRIAFEVETEEKYKLNRFNDGKADPRGRLYAGTMQLEDAGPMFETANANFYRYSGKDGIKKYIENIYLSNGLAWNLEKKKFYYIDSGHFNITQFDYDVETGDISNPSILIDFKIDGNRPSFAPDGMTIDAEGYLYVATWGGYKILKINPDNGKIELEVKLPAEQITSAAFGGPNLDILYVTSAATERATPQPSPAGSLFKITGLGKGLPMTKVKL